MHTPLHFDQTSTTGFELAVSNSASVMGQMSVQGVSRTASGRDVPGSVLMINLIESFNKMVALPCMKVWRNLSMPTVCVMGRVQLQIRRPGVFMKHTTSWAPTNCVLCVKGHLVIYAKEAEHLGYVVCLPQAKRLDMSSGRIERNDGKNGPPTIENYCTIAVKWKFGTVIIQLAEDQIESWRKAFIDAFDGRIVDPHAYITNNQDASRSRSTTNHLYRTGHTETAITEEDMSNVPDAVSGMDTDSRNDVIAKAEVFETETSEEEQKCLDTSHNTSGISECKTPKVESEKTANGNGEHSAESEDDNINSNMWSDDEEPGNTPMPQAMRRSYYASLPMSFSHRYRSDGALRLVPRGDHRTERQPLMEWLSQVGADDRFRRARTYFETGRIPPDHTDADNKNN